MAALMLKVGTLVLKQLAKPLANRFQAYIMSHPVSRGYTISAAQALHRVEVYITRNAEGRTGRAFIGDMTEEKSVELASKLASEGFVLAVGVGIVAFEYDRQRKKEMEKKEKEEQERLTAMTNARLDRERLWRETGEQTELINQLVGRIDTLEERVNKILGKEKNGWFSGSSKPPAQMEIAQLNPKI